ncbi:MAG: 50S ribosomal protein L4 [Candidatus Coatesbacteria bacterium]|nr:MAG: 50S ribosomal protein L4 [Candidatus Coatesbacteria bacterium]
MKTKLIDQVGRDRGEIELADGVFAAEPRPDLVHLCVVAQLAARRAGSAKTKTRSEVRGGGRKPYRQKGTGHSRQGTIRAPQWRGGGVAFGPAPRDYGKRIPRKVRRTAMRSAFSDKAREGLLRVIDRLDFGEYRTKRVVEILADLNLLDAKVLFVVDERNDHFVRSAANLSIVTVRHPGNVSVYEVLDADVVVLTEAAAKALEQKLAV